jgi:hypothetical protein
MSLAAVQDILADFPGWTTQFELQNRQEMSGQASGAILVKDLGPALWTLTAQSRQMRSSELRYWKARLASLDNGIGWFYGYDLAGKWPRLYPGGSWPTGGSFTGETAAIADLDDESAVLVGLDGFPAGFTLSTGDYFSVPTRKALHQAMEDVTADGSGVMAAFEVRPPLSPSIALDDAVSVKRAACVMMLVPGSVSANADLASGFGTVSFRGIQVI